MLKNSKKYLESCSQTLDVPIADVPIEQFPESWIKIFYKRYPRFKAIPLLKPKAKSSIQKLLFKRGTVREYASKPLDISILANLVYWSLGETRYETTFRHRTYASAGGRYPIECYVVALKTEGLKSGLYHYDIQNHSLELLANKKIKSLCKPIFYSKFSDAGAYLILTGVLSRNEVKYGTKALQYTFMEAGEICQNISLNCEEMELSNCIICGFDSPSMAALLDIDPYDEIPICCVAIGHKKLNNTEGGEKK